jgi:hypothetical protein
LGDNKYNVNSVKYDLSHGSLTTQHSTFSLVTSDHNTN